MEELPGLGAVRSLSGVPGLRCRTGAPHRETSVGRKKKRRGRRPGPELSFSGDLLDAVPVATLDLHGDTAFEAERRVKDFVTTHSRISRGKVIHIITGRGGGPGRPAVLPGVVRKTLGAEISRFVVEFDLDLDEAGFLVRLV